MITVEFPLSAGRTMISSFCFRDRSACLSSLDRFCFGALALRTTHATAARMPSARLSSKCLCCRKAVSTPAMISFFAIFVGVGAKFKPFFKTRTSCSLRFRDDRFTTQRSWPVDDCCVSLFDFSRRRRSNFCCCLSRVLTNVNSALSLLIFNKRRCCFVFLIFNLKKVLVSGPKRRIQLQVSEWLEMRENCCNSSFFAKT